MLKDTEWITVNNILLELYTIKDINILLDKTMKVIRMLIPYTSGYFILLNEDEQIIPEITNFVGMDKAWIDKYINHYYNEDYLKYLYEISAETIVYQDTNILSEDIRKNTRFYKMYLQPLDIPYGCGILLIKNNRIMGIFNLFRSAGLGDFSDKDIYILNIVKKHIENMIYNSMQFSHQQVIVDKCYLQMKEQYELTEREDEILKLISKGLSNLEICDSLVISMSTVKKHIYNIYAKTGVKSRTQLINLLYSM